MVKVEWVEEAAKDLRRLDNEVARRVLDKISWYAANFNQIVPEPLTGGLRGTYKMRVGDFRVVYKREGANIVILAVAHRKDVYKSK